MCSIGGPLDCSWRRRQAEAHETLGRAARQRDILEAVIARTEALAEPDAVPVHDLDLATLRKLAQRGWIALEQVEVLRNPLDHSIVERDMPPELTRQQATVLQPIIAAVDRDEQAAFLLHGVTGSGKTEIYLRAIARAMRQGHQALVLVPEIALTAQLVRRFTARFGATVAVLHSELSLGERYDTWRRLRRGEAQVVVGSRSVVFAPLPNLGLIVVDEEHDTSYKHVEGVRYQARDVALKLGEMTGSVVVLGSATPAVESYQAARDGRFQLVELHERVTVRGAHGSQSIPLPPVRVVDMRIELNAATARSSAGRCRRRSRRRLRRASRGCYSSTGVASHQLCSAATAAMS